LRGLPTTCTIPGRKRAHTAENRPDTSSNATGFVEHCLIPYLYSYSHLTQYGALPFGELAHGTNGLLDGLASLYSAPSAAIPDLVRLTTMPKRVANRHRCPCKSGRRLGTCHHRSVNNLRDELGRAWFRKLAGSLCTTSLRPA
jgi:hypothetical protein